MEHTKKELVAELQNVTEQLYKAQTEIRQLKANPPETIQRIIVEHKPIPIPIRGRALWLDNHGAVRWHSTTAITLPETVLFFDPRNIGVDTPMHDEFGLRIIWEMR